MLPGSDVLFSEKEVMGFHRGSPAHARCLGSDMVQLFAVTGWQPLPLTNLEGYPRSAGCTSYLCR